MTNDGGPAFPNTYQDGGELFYGSGMSIRDWFAGKALAGMIANQTLREDILSVGRGEEEATAHYAYAYADAMLAERESHTTGENPREGAEGWGTRRR